MPINKKATSKSVAKTASKELKSPKKIIRSVAGSGLSQVDKDKQTTSKIATKASKVLRKLTSSTKSEKKVAGSVLSQTPSKKKISKK
ncbi:MAG: hypothetical protein PHS92_05395 [Candidatus Gracilibacteria bacterium]|nr:hypothetical protein [Candidatus Gracilibacteria bacterium]